MSNQKSEAPPRHLYIFLDEGGNLDFSPKGTKVFTLTSVTMKRPFHMADPLDALKYDLIEFGLEIEYFHASTDKQSVRDRVYKIIQNYLHHIQVDTLIVEKRKTMPHLRTDSQFYPRMLSYLLNYPIERPLLGEYKIEEIDEVIIVTDTLPVERKRKAIRGAIKSKLKKIIPNTPFRIMHHSSKSSMELQIADYCNWAIYRKWEIGDTRSYDLIKTRIKSEFDIFSVGEKNYY